MRLLALRANPEKGSHASSNPVRREMQVESLWPHKQLLVLKFAGVDSISEAEVLVGAELQVPRSERAHLEPGWTYLNDLVGCRVFDAGSEIGRVEDVQFGAGEAPLLVVSDGAGNKFDIPFADAYLEAVDIGGRQLRMRLPPGLLEVNAPMTAEEKSEQVRSGRARSMADSDANQSGRERSSIKGARRSRR